MFSSENNFTAEDEQNPFPAQKNSPPQQKNHKDSESYEEVRS